MMDNDTLLRRIEESRHDDLKSEEQVDNRMVKFVIFRVEQKRYALYAEDIREIILGYPLFYVPFVPPYIRGFINRHGEPHTVIDLNVLFEQVQLEASTFLVLNRLGDQLALIISEICEIIKVRETDVHLIAGDTGDEDFFLGSVTIGEREIFIVDLDAVHERQEKDLATG
jgi:purine-binding chemotaxis protein CheW